MILLIQIVSSLFSFILLFLFITYILKFINNKYIKLFLKLWIDLLFIGVILSVVNLSIPVQNSNLMYSILIVIYFILFYFNWKKSIWDFISLYVDYKNNKLLKEKEKSTLLKENKLKNKKFFKNILFLFVFILLNMFLFNWQSLNDWSFQKTEESYLSNSIWDVLVDDNWNEIYYLGLFDREGEDWIIDEISYDLNWDNKIDLKYTSIWWENISEIIDYSEQRIFMIILAMMFLFTIYFVNNKKQKTSKSQVVASIILLSLFFNNIWFYDNRVSANSWNNSDYSEVENKKMTEDEFNNKYLNFNDSPKNRENINIFIKDLQSVYSEEIITEIKNYIDYHKIKNYNWNYTFINWCKFLNKNWLEIFDPDEKEFCKWIIDYNLKEDFVEDNNIEKIEDKNDDQEDFFEINDDDDEFVRKMKEDYQKTIIELDNNLIDYSNKLDDSVEKEFWDLEKKADEDFAKVNNDFENIQEKIDKENYIWNEKINNSPIIPFHKGDEDIKKEEIDNTEKINDLKKDIESLKNDVDKNIDNAVSVWSTAKNIVGVWSEIVDIFMGKNTESIKKLLKSWWKDSKTLVKLFKNKAFLKKYGKRFWIAWRTLSVLLNFKDKYKANNWDMWKTIVSTIASDIVWTIVSANPLDLAVWLLSIWVSGVFGSEVGDKVWKFTAWQIVDDLVKHATSTSPEEAIEVIKEQYDNVKNAKGFVNTTWAVIAWTVTTIYTGGVIASKVIIWWASKVLSWFFWLFSSKKEDKKLEDKSDIEKIEVNKIEKTNNVVNCESECYENNNANCNNPCIENNAEWFDLSKLWEANAFRTVVKECQDNCLDRCLLKCSQ